MKISKEQVDKAKARYENLLEQYLLERGWVVEDDLWVKEGVIGSGVLTNEEAYWEESKSDRRP